MCGCCFIRIPHNNNLSTRYFAICFAIIFCNTKYHHHSFTRMHPTRISEKNSDRIFAV